jgi:hypothetical protein
LAYDSLALMGLIFCRVVWLGLFSMRAEFVVVYNIDGILGIVGCEIALACFLV